MILPTGQILLEGGTATYPISPVCPAPVTAPEIYDPGTSQLLGTGSSTLMCPSTSGMPRLYHHLAVLLKDARVLVCGGEKIRAGCPVPVQPVLPHFTGELYSPPYLFLGHRPTITGITAPSPIPFYTVAAPTFAVNVQVSPGHTVVSAVLLRPAALTHHFDNDQRYIELAFSYDSVAGTVTAERLKEEYGPAGHYMLYVLEAPSTSSPRSDWAPSIGKFVEFQ